MVGGVGWGGRGVCGMVGLKIDYVCYVYFCRQH